MKLPLLFVTIFIVRANSLYQIPTPDVCNENEADAKKYVDSLSDAFDNKMTPIRYADWDYKTNPSIGYAKVRRLLLNFRNFTRATTLELETFCWKNFNNKNLTRLATEYFVKGDKVPKDIVIKFLRLIRKMSFLYKKTKLCKFEDHLDTNCKGELEMDSDLKEAMAKIRNNTQLKYYWTKWHNGVGNGMRDYFIKIVKLVQEFNKISGFNNTAERQLRKFEMDNFPSLMQEAYSKPFNLHGEKMSLEILYQEIHTYVKGKLMELYNPQGANIQKDGPIPAHLLGNMIAENWRNIIELALPFSNASPINVTEKLLEKNKTVKDLFKMADNFFSGLGFNQMTPKFWNLSLFEKPTDGTRVICGSRYAWNMNNKDDFRIRICSKVEDKYFLKSHEKMADIVLANEIKHLPYGYRDNVNPGIKKALSGLMGLAVMTPSYLHHVGLLDGDDNSTNNNLDDDSIEIQEVQYKKSDINYMMRVALEKIVHLPYSLARDSYRWKYFSGEISDSNLNGEFWKIVNDLQGLAPPVERNETNFDIGADYHIVLGQNLIEYYFSYISQFQFYEALCKKSNQYNPDDPSTKPLHLCDFSKGGKEIGKILKNAMGKGKSVPWTEIMKDITGVNKLSGKSMVKYFLPLYKYLKQENEQGGLTPWKSSK